MTIVDELNTELDELATDSANLIAALQASRADAAQKATELKAATDELAALHASGQIDPATLGPISEKLSALASQVHAAVTGPIEITPAAPVEPTPVSADASTPSDGAPSAPAETPAA